MLEIQNLTHYIVGEDSVKRTRFQYVITGYGYFDEIDVEGHVTLEEALSLVKSKISDELIHLTLKETMAKIDGEDSDYEFFDLDLRNLIFDIDIFDGSSELYQYFKRLIMKHWSDEFALAYHLVSNLKNIQIHDDSDKKTLYDHYFEGLNEFSNKISFMEYVSSKVTLPIVREPSPYIDMTKLVDYYIIDDTVKRSEIKYVLERNNVDINFTLDNKSHWEGFSYCYAMDNGLNDFEALSFARLFSKLLFESDEEFEKNEFIKEYQIEEAFLQGYLSTADEAKTVEEDIKDIFYGLYDIYANRIDEFEYKNRKLNFRISQRQYNRFMKVKGKTKSEKLENLINLYDEMYGDEAGDIDISNWIGDGKDYIEIVNVQKPIKNLKKRY